MDENTGKMAVLAEVRPSGYLRLALIMLIALSSGCYSSKQISTLDGYEWKKVIRVYAADSTLYRLDFWKQDTVGNVSGKGLRISGEAEETFEGTLSASQIRFFEIQELELIPTIIVTSTVLVVFSAISVWLFLNQSLF